MADQNLVAIHPVLFLVEQLSNYILWKFLHCIEPLKEKTSTLRKEAWKRKLKALPQSTRLNTTPEEKLPPGSNSGLTLWQCLNRLCTGVARTKTEMKK